MDFDEVIDRRGTHCMKWDMMERIYGVPSDSGIAMWVADMDFRPPDIARRALQKLIDHGIYGYFGDDRDYRSAICRWMDSRHGWRVEPDWIFTAHGLVNGTALCIDCFTSPGDGIVLFTPVYHAFARVINAAGRRIVECPLQIRNNRYEMNFAEYDRLMKGDEKMAILCSPHNPGGTVWTREELQRLAKFCTRHDLLLVSDEIHHDLVLPGRAHTPMPIADPSNRRPLDFEPPDNDDRHHEVIQYCRRALRQRNSSGRRAAKSVFEKNRSPGHIAEQFRHFLG